MSMADNPQQIVALAPAPFAQSVAIAAPGMGAAGVDTAVAGITAKDVWRVVKQRKVLIAVTWCVCYLFVGAGTFLVYRFAPTYYNEAYVKLIPPVQPNNPLTDPFLPKDYIEHQLATEANRIRDTETLLAVLALPEIKDTEFFRWYGSNFDKCLYDLQGKLTVTPVRDTYLIRVGIAVRNPREAKLIVNKIVERYTTRSKSTTTDAGRERIESLKASQTTIKAELDQVRERVNQLRSTRDMPAIESERQVLVETIAVLNNTLAELKAREADVGAQLETVRGVDPRKLPISAEMRVIIEADPVLRYYRQQVETLDIQLASLELTTLGRKHRQMQQSQAQREGYAQKETARREELIDDLRSRQVESLEQENARIRNMNMEVSEQLIEKENRQRDLDSAIQLFQNYTKDEDRLSREMEQGALNLRQAENVQSVQTREGRLEPYYAPRDPYLPSRPNLPVYLGGGFVLSALLALGLAFLREFTDQAIRTPIDVARYGHLSVLGCVPLLDDEEVDIEDIALATRRAPQSLVAEAFRQIRAHLTFSGPLDSQRTLLITSPRPEDGKTAMAINLAVTFAQGGQRVLLIDCNFRRPGIRSAFENTHADGLSNVLIGHRKLEQVISKTELPQLDLMTSGPMPPNPAELLGSAQMHTMLEAAKQLYDRVLLDGPPALLISDALVLSTQVDAVVMVARASSGSKGTLRRAREQFQRINARVIGAILNGVQARPGGYFRQQYREFYEYTSQEVVPQELPGPPEIESGSADSGDSKNT
jgi:polysaccharide biosynthesis transport protein